MEQELTRSMKSKIRFGKPSAIRPHVSVIIPVLNEKSTLPRVLAEARKVHPRTEIIVVANGTRDGAHKMAERMGARVVFFKEPLGHDVGRSIGAKEARADILLFLDGDMVIKAKDLVPFIKAVERGVDVALNTYSGSTRKKEVHGVVSAKYALNTILGKPALRGASLTTVPHAISRKALAKIGADSLAIPPMAQTAAVLNGLDVRPVHFINVLRLNKIRRKGRQNDPIGALIVGDHLEAIRWLVQQKGERAGKTDMGRARKAVR